MYNITAGINLAFKGKSKKPLLRVNHKEATRDKYKDMFPINKFSSITRENFILVNLYLNFSKSLKNFNDCIKALHDLDMKPIKIDNIKKEVGLKDIKEVYDFKRDIFRHKDIFVEEIDKIRLEESNISLDYMLDKYRRNQIKWFTLYLYLRANNINIDDIETRVDTMLLHKIKKLTLYVIFSEKSIKIMKDKVNISIKLSL